MLTVLTLSLHSILDLMRFKIFQYANDTLYKMVIILMIQDSDFPLPYLVYKISRKLLPMTFTNARFWN